MKQIPVAATIAIILGASGIAGADELKLYEWSHRALVGVADTNKGLAAITLPPMVFDIANPNLGDLRIVYDDGIEAPYVVNRGAAGTVLKRLDVTLYNRVNVPGLSSTVTADFGRKVMKNRIEIETAGQNFRRKVLVEGSDNGEKFQLVREGALIFRFAEGVAERTTVVIPQNDMRYLRVTVLNGPDDPEQVAIDDVRTFLVEIRKPRVEPVPVIATGVAEKERATEIVLDLGLKNAPLYELALSFHDDAFHRAVAVSGRNEVTRAVEAPKEGGGVVSRTVEVPWNMITRGVIYRTGAPGKARAPEDEALTLDIMGAQYRYLKLRIENGDDRPLSFAGAAVSRRLVEVEFAPRPGGGPLWLYAGNPSISSPQYDLRHHVHRLRNEGVGTATLGGLMPNPLKTPDRTTPWSERHKWILWAALLAAAAVMALLIWRQARGASHA